MWSVVTLVLLAITQVGGFSSFRYEIPNGDRVNHPCRPNYFWHGVGHNNALGGGKRNNFGIDFHNEGDKWTETLCRMDSDGDGIPNGAELGDPNCVWSKGRTPSRITDITHPGVCDPFGSAECENYNSWVSCQGTELECDAINKPDVRNFTIRFPPTEVPAEDTTYICMIFEVPSDQDYHYIASKPFIQNDEVMHHVIVYGCDDTSELTGKPYKCGMGAGKGCGRGIGGWTVGSPGDCLNEQFGILFGKSRFKRFALEFHWNNPKEVSGMTDSSGMTFYYTPNLRPFNGAIFATGQINLVIPPGKSEVSFVQECTEECTTKILNSPMYVTSASNHMHYLGKSGKVDQFRNGTFLRALTSEPNYSYDNPTYFNYDPPVEILPGDALVTTCTFQSLYTDKYVYYGDGTSDEMCFAFFWYFPETATREGSDGCVSWKSINICGKLESIVKDQCEVFNFVFQSDTTAAVLFDDVNTYCHLDSFLCTNECKNAVMNVYQHPCFQGGDVTEYLITLLRRSLDGMKFLSRLDMCDVKEDDYRPPIAAAASTSVLASVLVGFSVILTLY